MEKPTWISWTEYTKKADTKEYIPYDSTYLKIKHKQKNLYC